MLVEIDVFVDLEQHVEDLIALRVTARSAKVRVPKAKVSESQREQLRALGYLD